MERKKILLAAILSLTSLVSCGVQGAPGEKGDPGEKGETGLKGDPGEDGVGIVAIAMTSSNGNVDTYTITYSDGTTSCFDVTNGKDGSQGIQGKPGEDGHSPVVSIGSNGNWYVDGVDTNIPAKGEKGDSGEDGSKIFTGSGLPEDSLGKDGDIYIDTVTGDLYSKGDSWKKAGNIKGSDGDQGEAGENGKSAYELYVKYHPEYTGDEDQFMQDLINGNLGGQFTVTFDSNGGNETYEKQIVFRGNKINAPSDPTKDGYQFEGWYTEKGEKWVFGGCVVTEDMTLIAKWSERYSEGLLFYLQSDDTYMVTSDQNSYIKDLVIPDFYRGKKVTKIMDKAFNYASFKAASIKLPFYLKSIGDNPFYSYYVDGVTLNLPEGLETIGSYAFRYFKNSTINIPNTVTSLGKYALPTLSDGNVCTIEASTWTFTFARCSNSDRNGAYAKDFSTDTSWHTCTSEHTATVTLNNENIKYLMGTNYSSFGTTSGHSPCVNPASHYFELWAAKGVKQ